MKKHNLKMLAMSLIAALAISGCSVYAREYNRRPPRYHHHDDHHDHNHNYNHY